MNSNCVQIGIVKKYDHEEHVYWYDLYINGEYVDRYTLNALQFELTFRVNDLTCD